MTFLSFFIFFHLPFKGLVGGMPTMSRGTVPLDKYRVSYLTGFVKYFFGFFHLFLTFSRGGVGGVYIRKGHAGYRLTTTNPRYASCLPADSCLLPPASRLPASLPPFLPASLPPCLPASCRLLPPASCLPPPASCLPLPSMPGTAQRHQLISILAYQHTSISAYPHIRISAYPHIRISAYVHIHLFGYKHMPLSAYPHIHITT